MNLKNKYSSIIKSEAKKNGFDSCGISEAVFLENQAKNYEEWLKNNHHGKMDYMEKNIDKRLDPRKLFDGAKSVISLTYNYFTDKEQKDKSAPKISKYAFGEDYHFIIKKKMKNLIFSLKEKIGNFNGRSFVDSAPVMEKEWALRGGLGWIGKNTNIISKKRGSYFFIAEIIVDLELEYDQAVTDHCGNCTACIDSCPTYAIIEPYKLDASKCISYFTIELKDSIPDEFKNKMENWMFGCDICQDVCPWNRFSKQHNEPLFNPKSELLNMTLNDWKELTEDTFKKVFNNSPLKRTKFSGLKRNISFLEK